MADWFVSLALPVIVGSVLLVGAGLLLVFFAIRLLLAVAAPSRAAVVEPPARAAAQASGINRSARG